MANDGKKRGRDLFVRYKRIILLLSAFYAFFPAKLRIRLLERYRKTKGKMGIGIRYALLKSISAACGDNVAIYPDVYLLNAQNLAIGSNVSVHPMCYIECGSEKNSVVIGNNVSIAHGTTIMSTSHAYQSADIPIRDQGVYQGKVVIHDNVWLGAKSTILMGTEVKSGCIIAANAVVTKSTVADCIYAGIPAKAIKKRI